MQIPFHHGIDHSFQSPTSLTSSVRHWIAQGWAEFQSRRAERRQWRQDALDLSAHSDRELHELGFSRYDLPAVARGTYRR